MSDCWSRIVQSSPDTWINIKNESVVCDPCTTVVSEITSVFLGDNVETICNRSETVTSSTFALNLGSYNYLGFGGKNNECIDSVVAALYRYGVSTSTVRSTISSALHTELESRVAAFVGKEAALVCGQGFGTNTSTLQALFHKGDLIISDELNHTSIAVGCRCSGATVRPFRHADMSHLESLLRQAILQGHIEDNSVHPWRRIVIVVEGIYSMEGDLCPLPEIIALKKKYRAYLYIDEAHSIGALGNSGGGVCQHFGLPDSSDVDVLMGTFTKSFGAVGGYIAGSHALIDHLKYTERCIGFSGSASISLPAAKQVIQVLKILVSPRGSVLVGRLQSNAAYFRKRLQAMGVSLLGDTCSPVIPILLGLPAKIPCFSRLCLARNLAVVVVGFPATPLLAPRCRVCISASHTTPDLDYALDQIEEVVVVLHMRYEIAAMG